MQIGGLGSAWHDGRLDGGPCSSSVTGKSTTDHKCWLEARREGWASCEDWKEGFARRLHVSLCVCVMEHVSGESVKGDV